MYNNIVDNIIPFLIHENLFPRWSKWFKLPYEKYGTVMFDTHIYTWPHVSPDVAEVLRYNEPDLEKIRAFQEETGYPVIVGEFTLANLQ